ncbi:type II toxin-antitoxin system PemK/MazF family toxin [Brevibacillus borstelensis]|uniref:type II toxin-antitoxin system PemK/MazF family toxin n=1 Tax=Brevibacillus borstelensis TaxID=45462 RepID=UPI00046A7F4B|nr:type II toxin-antitoxin system PemK/MazF family toxin [Brevibacillus borstelensis]MCC0567521.1 type II toxin-antitoxin system PemK/MazF family toxin [Brevibacillus borstelensis]MCM3473502.1 type II toxin-antitoxin system PemK/MazF family toxin [Brevibacillus borstelensis]MCM3561450.1 type II toxin-antitoxin system PemK/MazF family toxin [Brevibacillus borstelensis]MCM3594006.1 type II toxin-antitoxin system PemK/MazF family toxin [Brevibacillus borstelensis]MED1855126.1 type II toxin-antito
MTTPTTPNRPTATTEATTPAALTAPIAPTEPDYPAIRAIADDDTYKGVSATAEQTILDNYPLATDKLKNFIDNQSAYDAASVMLEWKHWEQFKNNTTKPWKYRLRDIVFVNLGASNYGYEASYKHPCIIFGHMFNEVLVIPCSKGRYNKTSDFIIKGETADGFMHPSGIQLDKIRVISKNRIQGTVLGRVAIPKFNEITNKLIELYFEPVKSRIDNLEKRVTDLTRDNQSLTTSNEALTKTNEELSSKIEELEKQLKK